MTPNGILIPIGGNEDKGIGKSETETLEYIQESILARVVQETGNKDSLIAIVPTASSIPDQIIEVYNETFNKLGCTNIQIIDIRKREDSDRLVYLKLAKKASCIMFSGGDQSKIVKYIKGSELDKIIQERYHLDHLVVAGTSAGAMMMSHEMITGGGYKNISFHKGEVKMGRGMGLIPELIIDSHFIIRHRFGRLAEAVARFPKKIGIGLSENTALVIKNGYDCEVIGSGMVVLFDAKGLTYNNQKLIKEGDPMSLTNLKTHILANGNKLSFKNGDITFFLKLPNPEEILTK